MISRDCDHDLMVFLSIQSTAILYLRERIVKLVNEIRDDLNIKPQSILKIQKTYYSDEKMEQKSDEFKKTLFFCGGKMPYGDVISFISKLEKDINK